jgi:hypothetical protein
MLLSDPRPDQRKRNQLALKKRWALRVKPAKVEPSFRESTPTPAPVLAANHCQGERSCPFPPMVKGGRCRQHARDAVSEGSEVGNAHSQMRELGLITSQEA